MQNIQTILISRVDNIGDVLLSLPLCGVLKEANIKIKIFFLCTELTRPLVERSSHVDEIIIWNSLTTRLPKVDAMIHVYPQSTVAREAKRQNIKFRIGTNRRFFHWIYCNKLVNLTRKNSNDHEAILNIKLLKPLGIISKISKDRLWKYYGWKTINKSQQPCEKFKLIFHIKSRGSAKEWAVKNYFRLAKLLSSNTFQIYLTGTKEEGALIHKEAPGLINLSQVSDLTGTFSLDELIQFIQSSDGLIGASTGPLHIAAASGIFCLGLFPSQKPINALRWGPLGQKVQILSESNMAKEATLMIEPKDACDIIKSWI